MVDIRTDVDEKAARKMRNAAHLEEAIKRTEQLLESELAKSSKTHRMRWEERLAQQRRQLIFICR